MSKYVEMIISYIVDGDDFQYNDNHGVLIRCKDCKYYVPDMGCCDHIGGITYAESVKELDFCSKAEKREE